VRGDRLAHVAVADRPGDAASPATLTPAAARMAVSAGSGKHQRAVGVVPHAGDGRESGVGRDGGGVVTVTGEPVPGSGLVAGRRLGLRAGDRPVPGLGPLGSAIMTAVWAARRAGPHAAPGSSGAPG